MTGGSDRAGAVRGAMMALLSATMLAGCVGARSRDPVPIGPPPPALKMDRFYTRSIDAEGIPISSSARVSDAALRAARSIVVGELAHRPDLRRAMIARGQRVVVMAQDEGTMDLPEQRDWKKPTIDDPVLTVCERKHYAERIGRLSDRDYWNGRARGMGGLFASGAEENLLGVPGTRYYGENILVHEFSHGILSIIQESDSAFYREVERAYDHAMREHLWTGEYMATTVQEYWAEGTQFWFESNQLAMVDGVRILNADDLARHDPWIARLLARVYGRRHHLAGDIFWRHPARVPAGPIPTNTAERC